MARLAQPERSRPAYAKWDSATAIPPQASLVPQQFGAGGLVPEGQLKTFHGKPLGRQRAVAKGEHKVEKVMGEFKAGTLRSSSGAKVTKGAQAKAIALSEAREAGARIPRKKGH